jgi:WD40 repeat protein
MGIVYEAEQNEPRRRVALKVIRPGMMSGSLLRRFRHEAQMLGKLQHPGIAQIYEAGTADQGEGGQPYFAMELVSGRALLEYAEAHRLGTRQRLELMARICDAVHHAHLNGVIHRDLKPVNILVVDEGTEARRHEGTKGARGAPGFAQPKILDFGIARAIEADIQTLTVRTDVGQLLGTIAYMSPEQAAGDPAQLDIRSDVYALGVIAYELLSGRPPYNVHGKLMHEAVRVIREDEPSRLSAISRVFRGDVETVIAKALEKEKDRRYQSAAEFALDIRRYLSEQPIAARPASRLYQLRKFARRNKGIVTGVIVAFLALTVGTLVSIRQAVVARAAAVEAKKQAYHACLVAASSALRYHEVTDARRHLEDAPPEFRGWEWDHLGSRLDDSLLQLETRRTPMCMAVSPDGSIAAACASSGLISTWHVPDMTPIASYKLAGSVPQRRIAMMIFSADGRELRADAARGSTRLDAQTLQLIAHDDVPADARSDDGRLAAVIEDHETDRLVITELATGRELFGMDCRDAFNSVIRFAPDDKRVAICLRSQGGLTMHRTEDGEVLCRRPDLDGLSDLMFTADGSRAAVASMIGAAGVIDCQTGRDLVALNGHAASVNAIAFSPDESLIATASGDRTVRLWRAVDGSPIAIMHGNQTNVVDMHFAADGTRLMTASADGTIRWWDATITSDPFVLPAPGTIYGIAFSPDGSRLAAACLSGERPLRIWDVGSGKEILATGEGYLSAIAFNHDGTQIAVGRSGTALTSIFESTGSEITTLPGHWWRTTWVAFNRDGNQLLSLGNGGKLLVHDIATRKVLQGKRFPDETAGEGCRAAISPDGTLIAIVSGRDTHLLDLKTLNEIAVLQGHDGTIHALAFSPDGKRLVCGSTDHMLVVWDIARRQQIATLAGHSDEVFAVVFSPDGKRILSGGRDRVIRVWNADTYEELTQLHGHTSFIYCLAFSPDGRTLSSGGGDDTVRLWGVRAHREQLPVK